MSEAFDLSDAIVVFLKGYPGKNEQEFTARFGPDAAAAVHAMMTETLRTHIIWGDKSLIDIGEEVIVVMRQRHPELSEAALEKLSNYFTYNVR